jgi:uncharacterized protein YdbL (DUF1318 family)
MRRVLSVFVLFLMSAQFSAVLASAPIERMKKRVKEVVRLKNEGVIGERRNGLLGIVQPGNEEAEKIVAAENKDRMAIYKKRSMQQGEDLNTFQRVLGDAKVRKEKSGRFVEDEKGSWVKKN